MTRDERRKIRMKIGRTFFLKLQNLDRNPQSIFVVF
jgi:hypothetical protein